MLKKFLLTLLSVMIMPFFASAQNINGAGASFPYPVYSAWAYYYEKAHKLRVNYQSIGSGGGIKQITEGTVDFGATDEPLSEAELKKANLTQFPAITGGIVVIVNIDGLKKAKLVLDGSTTADIFLGKITKWNDPKIAALNKSLNLPDQKITVIRRSDSSGTTAVFTKYLSESSDEWNKTVGTGKSVNWKTGLGAKGNDGVTNLVRQTKNSIGYTEFTYAEQAKVSYTSLVNKSGSIVEASLNSFSIAASGTDWTKSSVYAVSLTNSNDKNAWPIVAASFILVRNDRPEVKARVMNFFKFAFEQGDNTAKALKYVPLPANLKTEISSKIK